MHTNNPRSNRACEKIANFIPIDCLEDTSCDSCTLQNFLPKQPKGKIGNFFESLIDAMWLCVNSFMMQFTYKPFDYA